MSLYSVSTLITALSPSRLFQLGLELAAAVGLPVTSWRVGDPTRALYELVAEKLALRESWAVQLAASAWLSTVSDEWLPILAEEVFGIVVPDATYAASTITLENIGDGYFEIGAGDLTVKSSLSGATYRSANASPVTLAPGDTVEIDVIADVAGSDGSAGEDEIDTLVTTLVGVEITASTIAIGLDQPTPEAIKDLCRASLGALSPNGPRDAYEYVCTNQELTGVTDITRAETDGDTDTGDVVVTVAGSSGAVVGASVTAAQSAIDIWATPWTVTAVVLNSGETAVDVTATIYGVDLPVDLETPVTEALGVYFASLRIGRGVALSKLIEIIHRAIPNATSVVMTVPAADVTGVAGVVLTVGTITITEGV